MRIKFSQILNRRWKFGNMQVYQWKKSKGHEVWHISVKNSNVTQILLPA